jgi:type I restriction enzyme, S subunit
MRGGRQVLVKLGDIAEFVNGGAWSDTEYSPDGIPVVRVTDIRNWTIDLTDCKFLPISAIVKYKKHILEAGDLIISTVGSHPNQPGSVVGRPAIVPAHIGVALLNQNAVRIRANVENVDQRWLGCFGRSSAFRNYIVACARGAANQVRMAIGLLKEMPIELPSLSVQRRIGEVVSAYDELIEVSQEKIRVLESLGRTLYRERFPNDRAAQATLGEFCFLAKDKYLDKSHSDLPLLDLSRIPQCRLAPSDLGGADELKTSRVTFQSGDTLFGSIRCYLHKVVNVSFPGVTNTSVLVLRPLKPVYRTYVALSVSDRHAIRWADTNSTGLKMPVIKWSVFQTMPMKAITDLEAEKFELEVGPILDEIGVLAHQIRNLRNTRDLLLPRLLSGQIALEV